MGNSVPPPGLDESLVEYEKEETHAIQPVSPWIHFVAGGIAGMAGAVVTCPLDVVKTRMQSDMMQHAKQDAAKKGLNAMVRSVNLTFTCIGDIYKTEGWRALFRGLGPNLAGVVPARAVNFFTYGVSKQFYSQLFNDKQSSKPATHLFSGITAGFVTSAITNPIWMVKTRMQLDRMSTEVGSQRVYRNSLDCLYKVIKTEGVPALYRGLSASLIGSSETSIQWVLYEQMRRFIYLKQLENRDSRGKLTNSEKFVNWSATSGAAGLAKLIASLIAYPHEVVRTRLRQAPVNGELKYRGMVSCFRTVYKQEGALALYGGLAPHLMRTVPNSIIMFGTWDLIVQFISKQANKPSAMV